MSTTSTCSPACAPGSNRSLCTREESAISETTAPARAARAEAGRSPRVPTSDRAVEKATVPSASQAVAPSTCSAMTGLSMSSWEKASCCGFATVMPSGLATVRRNDWLTSCR